MDISSIALQAVAAQKIAGHQFDFERHYQAAFQCREGICEFSSQRPLRHCRMPVRRRRRASAKSSIQKPECVQCADLNWCGPFRFRMTVSATHVSSAPVSARSHEWLWNVPLFDLPAFLLNPIASDADFSHQTATCCSGICVGRYSAFSTVGNLICIRKV